MQYESNHILKPQKYPLVYRLCFKFNESHHKHICTFRCSRASAKKKSGEFSRSVMSNSLRPHGMQKHQASLSITNSHRLLKLMFIESVMASNHLILCCPLLLLPEIFPSIRVFSNESVLLIRWPKYWSFSICPSNEYSELISFWMDWFDLLGAQGTLKSLLQHHDSKASILRLL